MSTFSGQATTTIAGPESISSPALRSDTRQTIVNVAFELFSSRGYHATSMRDIAAGVGITAGSIYNHFKDKDTILQEVLISWHPFVRVLPLLEDIPGQSLEEFLIRSAERILAEVWAHPGIISLIYVELVELQKSHGQAIIDTVLPAVEAWLARVQRFGELRSVEPATFFRSFLGLLLGYGFSRIMMAGTPLLCSDPPVRDFVHLFLQGVADKA